MKKSIQTIVIFATILLPFFILEDTGLFVYPFLSNVYFIHLYALGVLALVFIILLFKDKSKVSYPSIGFLVFFAWGLYIGLSFIISSNVESYFTTYLIVFFFISLSLFYLSRNHFIHPHLLLIPIALAGLVEAVVSLLQYLHILTPLSTFFLVTGTTDNPNIAAMFITLAFPPCITITKLIKSNNRYAMIIVLIVMIASLFILQCRSALIGAIVIALVYLIVEIQGNSLKTTGIYKILIFTGIIATVVFTVLLHQNKKASTDGRLTIWKISGEMIAKQPFFGYGYGLFQREYNLKQAEYFNHQTRPEQERMNAGFTAMAYNEYIEQTIMGGIPGGILFTVALITLLWSGWRRKQECFAPLAGIAAFTVMSMINYTIQSPLIFFAFMIYATLILAQENSSIYNKTYTYPRKFTIVFCMMGIIFTIISLKKYSAQKQLKIAYEYMQKGNFRVAERITNDIGEDISTSEAFYRTKSELLARKHHYVQARIAMDQALQYTSSIDQLLKSARLMEKLGDYSSAEQRYRIVCGIEPHKFRPRVMLMRLYSQTGQNVKKTDIARYILGMNAKFPSKEVDSYKLEAGKMLVETQLP